MALAAEIGLGGEDAAPHKGVDRDFAGVGEVEQHTAAQIVEQAVEAAGEGDGAAVAHIDHRPGVGGHIAQFQRADGQPAVPARLGDQIEELDHAPLAGARQARVRPRGFDLAGAELLAQFDGQAAQLRLGLREVDHAALLAQVHAGRYAAEAAAVDAVARCLRIAGDRTDRGVGVGSRLGPVENAAVAVEVGVAADHQAGGAGAMGIAVADRAIAAEVAAYRQATLDVVLRFHVTEEEAAVALGSAQAEHRRRHHRGAGQAIHQE